MPAGAVKFELDVAIGETSQIESTDKGKMTDIEAKVKDLNSRLQDVRREQIFQRVALPVPSFRENILTYWSYRNEKQNLETNLNLRMRGWFDGR